MSCERIPRQGFDLYLNIDDGLRITCRPTCVRAPGGPSIPISISTGASTKSRGFDLVFAAQRDGAEQLRRAGIASAAWLPLACDPEIHRKHDVAKQYDVAFVGNVFPGPRAELLELIRADVSPLVHRPVLLRGDGPHLFLGRGRSSTAASRTTSTCGSSRPWPAGRCW